MNKTILVVIVVLLVVVGAYFVVKIDSTEVGGPDTSGQNLAKFSSNDLGFEFSYPVGPEGYVLQEAASAPNNPDNIVGSIILFLTKDKMEIDEGKRVDGEGPPTINVIVFENTKNQDPLPWALENSAYSNINLKIGDTTETVVGGANAIRYKADGLYASDTVVVAHGGYVYLFSGSYIDEQSPQKKDFGPLIDSVRFIPRPGQE